MRYDNFMSALRAQLVFGAVGALALIGFGLATSSLLLPKTFWLTVGLYPIWGVAQQFALQGLIARNLGVMLTSPLAIAGVASALFAAVHYPRIQLVVLTGVAGVFLTLVYRRHPNLWAVGIVHGILGSLAVYIVLKEDPGAAIWRFVVGHLWCGALDAVQPEYPAHPCWRPVVSAQRSGTFADNGVHVVGG